MRRRPRSGKVVSRREQLPFFSRKDSSGCRREQIETPLGSLLAFQDGGAPAKHDALPDSARTAKTKFDRTLCAGDLVAFDVGSRMIVVTVAHVFKSGTDSGGGMDAYSRLWLGEVEE